MLAKSLCYSAGGRSVQSSEEGQGGCPAVEQAVRFVIMAGTLHHYSEQHEPDSDLFYADGRSTALRAGGAGMGRAIALDIARGLTFLHSNNIAHMDLKTPNGARAKRMLHATQVVCCAKGSSNLKLPRR